MEEINLAARAEQLETVLHLVKINVDYALKDYPRFNSERCVSILLNIRSELRLAGLYKEVDDGRESV